MQILVSLKLYLLRLVNQYLCNRKLLMSGHHTCSRRLHCFRKRFENFSWQSRRLFLQNRRMSLLGVNVLQSLKQSLCLSFLHQQRTRH